MDLLGFRMFQVSESELGSDFLAHELMLQSKDMMVEFRADVKPGPKASNTSSNTSPVPNRRIVVDKGDYTDYTRFATLFLSQF